MRAFIGALCLIAAFGCKKSSSSTVTTSPTPVPTTDPVPAPTDPAPTDPAPTPDPTPVANCGHMVDPAIVALGENVVLDETGAEQAPQGRPIQEGWTLARAAMTVTDHNAREYARVASYMMPIRDALMCNIASTSLQAWQALTAILTLNGIKTVQDLSGNPMEQVYSTDGIYEHARDDPSDEHAVLKYVEEAELELKCLAFVDFDFTNPEGDNHCVIHGLAQGSGLIIP